jgi:hypothetical protein
MSTSCIMHVLPAQHHALRAPLRMPCTPLHMPCAPLRMCLRACLHLTPLHMPRRPPLRICPAPLQICTHLHRAPLRMPRASLHICTARESPRTSTAGCHGTPMIYFARHQTSTRRTGRRQKSTMRARARHQTSILRAACRQTSVMRAARCQTSKMRTTRRMSTMRAGRRPPTMRAMCGMWTMGTARHCMSTTPATCSCALMIHAGHHQPLAKTLAACRRTSTVHAMCHHTLTMHPGRCWAPKMRAA